MKPEVSVQLSLSVIRNAKTIPALVQTVEIERKTCETQTVEDEIVGEAMEILKSEEERFVLVVNEETEDVLQQSNTKC